VPALDLLDVKVGPRSTVETGEPVQDGGFTVTMTYDDLSPGALQGALTGLQATSLVYLFRFFDGYQPGGATAFYEPLAGGWRFGYNDYTTTIRNPQGNLQTYKGDVPVPGKVDEEAGTITLSVPRNQIEALDRPGGADQRPEQVPATVGSRIYDGSAWTFSYQLPTSRVEQTFLTQADNSAAMDFQLTAAGRSRPRPCPVPAGRGPGNEAPRPRRRPPAGHRRARPAAAGHRAGHRRARRPAPRGADRQLRAPAPQVCRCVPRGEAGRMEHFEIATVAEQSADSAGSCVPASTPSW
jgi:hypothetical protein